LESHRFDNRSKPFCVNAFYAFKKAIQKTYGSLFKLIPNEFT